MKLLLDTCTFLWLAANPELLSKSALKALKDNESSLYLSDVSALEIAFKCSSKKLTLPRAPANWIEEQIDEWQLHSVPLTRSVIYRAGELPLIHRDPFDRLIIATALESKATVISPDKILGEYPVSVVW